MEKHISKQNGLKTSNKKVRNIVHILFALVLTSLILASLSPVQSSWDRLWSRKPSKKNVIFFVTDGMGPASLSLTRSFRQFTQNLTRDDILVLDHHLVGSSRTMSSSSLITDSAAGATAFSCALKSYNGAIGVDPEKQPCGTVLEAAKLQGYLTGLVVTTRITDATPAAFSSHVDYRFQEDLIAQQQLGDYPLGRMVDLIIGGGRTHFYSDQDAVYGSRGSRADGRNLIKEAVADGWSYVGNRKEFDSLDQGHNVSLPLLALLADYDIPFDLDREDSEYPSLEEEAMTAINALSEATKDSDKGFFLLVEGSRIDHAGHQNDPAAQVREVLAFDKAFEAVLKYAEDSDVETILISTSDHETGGLVTAKQVSKAYPEYVWYPQVLSDAHHSGEFLSKELLEFKGDNKSEFIEKAIFEQYLGISDYTEKDTNELLKLTSTGEINDKLNGMISTRARVGWTTHGHSAVDVNIYAYANRQKTWYNIIDHLQGNHENTEIGQFMADYLELDLEKVTQMIKKTKHSPNVGVRVSATLDMDEYHRGIYN
ncbi:LANO_0E09802g1_1 [Lachancea nothofagi CBS 11611]|uniref:Alkaline phosphatase n=1 Tax=Lachancea nothofagi CBS 11611 TaxID=1266666 RepID=A0A1G4JW81_9SACH|nr:LANO_0E09802g1_1 [Lachancea nothofagi CBS 11611]